MRLLSLGVDLEWLRLGYSRQRVPREFVQVFADLRTDFATCRKTEIGNDMQQRSLDRFEQGTLLRFSAVPVHSTVLLCFGAGASGLFLNGGGTPTVLFKVCTLKG